MNINILADSIYKKIANAGLTYPGLHYGMSVQNGQYGYYIKHDIREINRDELLYTTNLALLYGSKLLSPWIYFGWCNIPVPDPITGKWECYTGFSNYQDEFEVTDKYSTLKDTITPRLSGLMGITLRKLKPYKQFAGSNGIETLIQQTLPSDFDYINSIRSYGASTEYTFIELGFFSNPNDQAEKYFMPLNRYYSKLNNFTIGLRNLSGFKNWNLTYYEDNKFSNTIISNNGISSFAASIYPGDAKLFRLVPVLTHGGSLIADETVNGGTTLLADMTIENGVTLTVNDTYYANANITVKTGGKIIAGQNAKIIFAVNKGLIIGENAQPYGTSAQIYGTSNNRLTLEFNSNTSTGVEVRFYYALTMSYCDIKNAFIGINAENASYINISNVNFTNCQYTGIVLFSFGNGDSNLSASSSTISNCIITGSSTGISVVNADELVIKENLINNCNLGIYLNQVNSSYIISNTILGWQSATGSPMPGISMSNGGGYLRNNTIRYHNYGVELVYSSPDMGVNTIENNYKCGLYISSGSYPNLVQQLANPQCWYPIGGCNVIRNNGTFTQLPPSTPSIQPDGAEIFLNSGDVLLSYGYNEISDDRTGIPEYLILPLIKGTRSSEGSREFFVDRNYWGTVGTSSLRFGTLQVIYNPTADYCPLPDAPCSGSELIIQTTDGQIIDTLDSRARESTEISALEETYSTADKLYYNGAVEESKTYYQMIVEGNYTNEEKLYAYNKLYEIGNLLKEDDNYFSALQNAFSSIIAVETDTLLLKAFNQKSILCDVSKQEYLTAISKFDNIIQQNPNSEEAVYAEIDIITTALNLDTTNSQLGKMGGGKYLVKGTSDYLSKLNNLLQNKFGISAEEKEQIIPKEYSLYQNYPNPFNPSTTIKFDIPKDGLITLEIFDILGRRIVTLINENRSAGSYDQVFNASSLASGVYVYKLQSGDFISSKKMLLLK